MTAPVPVGRDRTESFRSIVDAQIHLWESPTGPAHHRSAPLGADEVIEAMDLAGVDRVINCPALWDPRANDIANVSAARYPSRIATMGWLPLSPGGDGSFLATWKDQPGMLGLRFALLNETHRAWFDHGNLDWIWAAAERFGLPLALAAPGSLHTVARIAAAFPNLRLMVDHFGAGAFGQVPDVFKHFPQLLSLASFPNVAIKATAAPGYAVDDYPFRSVHSYLEAVFDRFGPRRMFWGTDITRMRCSWRQCVTMFTEELSWLRGDDLAEVMGRAVCRWTGWWDGSVAERTIG